MSAQGRGGPSGAPAHRHVLPGQAPLSLAQNPEASAESQCGQEGGQRGRPQERELQENSGRDRDREGVWWVLDVGLMWS